MKVKVTYYQGGNTWHEVIIANNVTDAREIGMARNPNIKIIALSPVP
tara:strand:- start:399 stop:539 length:141 start_codon:yes stop_codon:yes gene_type:complete